MTKRPIPIDPSDEDDNDWQTVGQLMIMAVMAMVILVFTLLFFAGFYLYSLL